MIGNVIWDRCIPAGADLREELRRVATACEAHGWTIERDHNSKRQLGLFFMRRAGERQMVNLVPDKSFSGGTERPVPKQT